MTNIFQEAARLLDAGEPFALAILVDNKGSTPQKRGAKAIFLRDGRCIGTLGGGCLEMEAKRRAIEALEKREPLLFKLVLDNDFGWDDGLICGGSVEIFLEPRPELHSGIWKQLALPPTEKMEFRVTVDSPNPNNVGEVVYSPITQHAALSAQHSTQRDYIELLHPKPVLVIAGAGHVGYATAKIAAMVDFDVVVIDDRAAYANKERFPEAKQVIAANPADALRDFPIKDDTYICVITRGHRNDANVLRECISSTAAYIGMIGSKRKIRKIFDEFMQQGIATEKQLKRVHSPIGLDIGSVTVEEIAVSIVAQLVQVRAEKRKQG
ncbi:MAG: XdhC/CoxI family protein [Verrucomicrobiae bacterium]|nr:XdhC/CoxI family protein [Verrucomicrobiae bacterium]